MFFAKPGPEELASLVPCFYTEDSGLRLAALTALRVEVLCVAEADGVGKRVKTGKITRCHCRLTRRRTAGSCVLSSKSPNMWYPIMGDNRGPHIRSSTFWN
jgi:hypothetical protein